MSERLKSRTIRSLIWSGMESISVSALNLLFGIILARILLPQDFGIVAILQTFIFLSQTLVDSGMSNALIRQIKRTFEDCSTVFWFNIAISIGLYAILFGSAPLIADFFNIPILEPTTKVLSLTLIINSASIVHQTLLTANLDFRSQTQISLISIILSSITGVILAYNGCGVWAIVIQQLLNSIIRTTAFWYYSKWQPKLTFSRKSFSSLFSFGSKLLLSGIIDTIYTNIHSLIIGKIFDLKNLGLYSKAYHLSRFIPTTLTAIVQRVSYPVMSEIQDKNDQLNDNFSRMIKMAGFITFPIAFIFAATSDSIINVLLTEKWIGIVPYIHILTFYFIWYPINSLNLNLLQVKGRSDLFLKLEIIKVVIGLLILAITASFSIRVICWGLVSHSTISLIINMYYTEKFINFGFKLQLKAFMPSLINAIIAGLVAYFLHNIAENHLAQIFIGLTAGISIYYFGSLLLCSGELKEISLLLKSLKNGQE